MSVITMKSLLESGVHFGHTTRRWNPKMAEYIYTSRSGIHIIDLQKSQKCIDVAYDAMKAVVEAGGRVIFVGTKKQAADVIKEEAERCGEFYVNQRWLGGTLTNYKTISLRIHRLHELYKMEEDGSFDLLPKKEVVGLKKERARLEKFLGGIKDMKKTPQAMFIIDPKKERNAILEARILKIPTFGVIDTNCDPDDVDYVIPANDDAIRSLKLILSVMANAVCDAKGLPLVDLSPSDKPDPRRNNRRNDSRNSNYKDGKSNFKPVARPVAKTVTSAPVVAEKPVVATKPVAAKPVAEKAKDAE